MNFASRELSHNDLLNIWSKLSEMGCKLSRVPNPMDFLGNDEIAYKNCEIVWGDRYSEKYVVCPSCEDEFAIGNPGFKFHRHAYLDSGKNFWEYLSETIKMVRPLPLATPKSSL